MVEAIAISPLVMPEIAHSLSGRNVGERMAKKFFLLVKEVSSITTQSSETSLSNRSTMPIVKARYLHVSLRVKRVVVVTS